MVGPDKRPDVFVPPALLCGSLSAVASAGRALSTMPVSALPRVAGRFVVHALRNLVFAAVVVGAIVYGWPLLGSLFGSETPDSGSTRLPLWSNLAVIMLAAVVFKGFSGALLLNAGAELLQLGSWCIQRGRLALVMGAFPIYGLLLAAFTSEKVFLAAVGIWAAAVSALSDSAEEITHGADQLGNRAG